MAKKTVNRRPTENGNSAETTEGHDAAGRFALGNSGGPGRPRRLTGWDYLREAVDAVPRHKWRAIVEAAVERAVEGDDRARSFVASLFADRDALTRLAAADAAGVDLSAVDVDREVAVLRLSETLSNVSPEQHAKLQAMLADLRSIPTPSKGEKRCSKT